MNNDIIVSAPGSTMVTGEHAVVHGAPAVVAAVAQRAHIRFRPTEDPVLSVTSEIAPSMTMPLDALVAEGPYRFVIASVLAYRDRLERGLKIDISSQIDHTLGLGSSAAVTVAMLAGLKGSTGDDIHTQALKIIRDQQGRGSGADLAASLHGGVLSYQITGDGPAQMAPLPQAPRMSLFNVGYKTPTAEVLARVASAREKNPTEIDAIYKDMTDVSRQTIERIQGEGWDGIGPLLAEYQVLMAELGVSDTALEAAVVKATATNGVIGAKISGSGLGDCVLALGAVPVGFEPVEIATQGVIFHDNS